MKSGITALAAALLCLSSCLDDEGVPPINPSPPASCGNGTCELETEGCVNCPGDCDCCAVVDAAGNVPVAAELPFAEGQPDQQVVQLDELSDLFLTLGSEALDIAAPGAKELTIHGSVTSSSELFDGCLFSSGGTGAVEVWALDAEREALIGLWTGNTTTFDLACGQLTSARMIHLRAQPGASATFDALTVAADACRGGQF